MGEMSGGVTNDSAREVATMAGEVVTAECRQAMRSFEAGGDVHPGTDRVLSTMAVRIVVQLLARPTAAAAGDPARLELLADLFLTDE